jgi:hypothetical protein
VLKIKGKPVRVWQLPLNNRQHIETTIEGAKFNVGEAPF